MTSVSRRMMVGLLAMTAASSLHAQTLWPGERPVQIIAPSPPGSGTDVHLRAVVPHLERLLPGARVIVLNRPGAEVGYTAATMRDPAWIAEAERLFIPLRDLAPAAMHELVFPEQAALRELWTRRSSKAG